MRLKWKKMERKRAGEGRTRRVKNRRVEELEARNRKRNVLVVTYEASALIGWVEERLKNSTRASIS